jgi:SH3-like domain-containing protein
LPELTRADELFRQSSVEFANENYGGALYLATQVRTLVRAGQTRLRGRGEGALAAGETVFAVPVPLNTTGRANVRAGPGTNFAVAFTLDPSTAVTGQSYTSQWIRVVDGQSREGWIFNTLVTSRP